MQQIKNAIRLSAVVLLSLALALPLFACEKKADPAKRTHFALDTVIDISVYDGDKEKAADACIELIDRCERLFSRTIEGSDVWRINHANSQSVEVDPMTADMINIALRYSELSGGKFDITIAPVSSLWDFKSEAHVVPDAAKITEGIAHVGYRQIQRNGNTVSLSDPKGAIDLGAIAKGYIADRMVDLLKTHHVKTALINLGGNVVVLGNRPDGTPWRVGVQGAFKDRNTPVAMFSVSDLSVVTSGIYERYFELDGNFYHHILDPETGYPIDNSLAAVSILSQRSVDGDCLSTTCFTLGEDGARALIESLSGIEAVFITKDGTITYTSGIGTDDSAQYKIKLLEKPDDQT